jgi:hypothetical protein
VPNGVPKGDWLSFLNLIGDWWNWNKFDLQLKQAYQDTQQGQLKQSTYDFLKTHQASWFCETAQALKQMRSSFKGLEMFYFLLTKV